MKIGKNSYFDAFWEFHLTGLGYRSENRKNSDFDAFREFCLTGLGYRSENRKKIRF